MNKHKLKIFLIIISFSILPIRQLSGYINGNNMICAIFNTSEGLKVELLEGPTYPETIFIVTHDLNFLNLKCPLPKLQWVVLKVKVVVPRPNYEIQSNKICLIDKQDEKSCLSFIGTNDIKQGTPYVTISNTDGFNVYQDGKPYLELTHPRITLLNSISELYIVFSVPKEAGGLKLNFHGREISIE